MTTTTPQSLVPAIDRLFSLAQKKIADLDRAWDPRKGTPVFTVNGRYKSRGWTEWTQGFQYGCAILTFDATDDPRMLKLGRDNTVKKMAPHVTHIGVHDHGFNNLSTYGNLRRLMREKRIAHDEWELAFYGLALKASGAVQAARWSGAAPAPESKWTAKSPWLGYVYSFNGPHSLFIDTMRTIRILGVAWQLGHVLMHENDKAANLLKRSVLHALTTAHHLVFHGETSHAYDIRGRTAHEGVFNRNDGAFRCRSSQQGYSPFSTWTRGLAWAMLGYAEQLEFLQTISPDHFRGACGLALPAVLKVYRQTAIDTCDHYLHDASASDHIPYWDDGAPGLAQLGDWRHCPADPFNDHEPVDASAAAIAAQGLIRLGNALGAKGRKYLDAGLSMTRILLDEPYLSISTKHQGLLLHSIYHRPNHWDHVPPGSRIPRGESSLWGDYHLLELALLVRRMAKGQPYLRFFDA